MSIEDIIQPEPDDSAAKEDAATRLAEAGFQYAIREGKTIPPAMRPMLALAYVAGVRDTFANFGKEDGAAIADASGQQIIEAITDVQTQARFIEMMKAKHRN